MSVYHYYPLQNRCYGPVRLKMLSTILAKGCWYFVQITPLPPVLPNVFICLELFITWPTSIQGSVWGLECVCIYAVAHRNVFFFLFMWDWILILLHGPIHQVGSRLKHCVSIFTKASFPNACKYNEQATIPRVWVCVCVSTDALCAPGETPPRLAAFVSSEYLCSAMTVWRVGQFLPLSNFLTVFVPCCQILF